MTDENIRYIFAVLDLYLGNGHAADDAWRRALEDYAAVYHAMEDDDRTPFSRAAERGLNYLLEGDSGQEVVD